MASENADKQSMRYNTLINTFMDRHIGYVGNRYIIDGLIYKSSRIKKKNRSL